jgi:hypothetical protein
VAARDGTTAKRAVVVRSSSPQSATRDALDGLDVVSRTRGKRRACVAVTLGSATYVSPAVLSETLVFLRSKGFVEPDVIALVPLRDRDAGWDVESLSARHDLPFDRLPDAWSFIEAAEVGDAHVIQGRPVPEAWQRADLRILLTPCATDALEGCALALAALSDLVPLIAGADPADVVTDVLQTMAPHVSLIDAMVTSDGPAGSSVRRPVHTDTVIASSSAVLADVVVAVLLGVDPLRPPLISAVVDVLGLPVDFTVIGDLTAFPGLVHPPEHLLRSTNAAPDARSVSRVMGAAMADEGVTTSGEDVMMTLLRQAIRPWLTQTVGLDGARGAGARTDGGPDVLAWASSSAAASAGYVQAWRTTFAKDSVPRRRASLGLNLSAYTARDFEAAELSLRPLLRLLDGLPIDRDGLRWMHIDGAVVFEASRIVLADYESWVARVDVSRAISMMADYLGGRTVVVARDPLGRTTRQAERNIYLPQPNYIAFSGGQVIDVCKLSVVRHRADSCAIWWRTVRSPNRSALHDDGTVEFSAADGGRTKVVIRGRQQFALPAAMQSIDLDLAPDVRNALTQDAYRRFFLTTLDNFEACYEGRDFAIGQDPDEEIPTIGLSRLARAAQGAMTDLVEPSGRARGVEDSLSVTVDVDGFTHVSGSRRRP